MRSSKRDVNSNQTGGGGQILQRDVEGLLRESVVARGLNEHHGYSVAEIVVCGRDGRCVVGSGLLSRTKAGGSGGIMGDDEWRNAWMSGVGWVLG